MLNEAMVGDLQCLVSEFSELADGEGKNWEQLQKIADQVDEASADISVGVNHPADLLESGQLIVSTLDRFALCAQEITDGVQNNPIAASIRRIASNVLQRSDVKNRLTHEAAIDEKRWNDLREEFLS